MRAPYDPRVNKTLLIHAASPEPELPLTERAYRRLRQAIVRCDFEPGQRLRVEELGRMFEISSSPLREALSRLSEQGFVRAYENKGFRVAPLTVAGVSDLTRVRLLVECEALRDAMAHGDDQWEAGLVAAAHSLGLVEQRLDDGPLVLNEAWALAHRAFHLAIYAGTSSPMLFDLVELLFDRAERYRQFSARHRKIERRKNSEHKKLMTSVLSREVDPAVMLLCQHISATERNVTAALLGMEEQGLLQ